MPRDEIFELPEDDRFQDARSESFEDRNAWFASDVEPETTQEESLTRHWGWVLILGVAWLLFEVFAEPAISVMVASLALGWNDFLSSLWLWRRDPDRRRGRACAAFYLAAGFWRITVVTFVLIGVATLISIILDFRHGRKDELVTGIAMMIIGLCFISSGLTTCVAVVLTLRRKFKVWLDPQLRMARRKRQWPPRSPGPNRLGRVITSTVALLAIIELILGFVFVGFLINKQQNGQGNVALGVFVCVMTVVPIAAAASTILLGREWAAQKLKAETPGECWPDTELEPKP